MLHDIVTLTEQNNYDSVYAVNVLFFSSMYLEDAVRRIDCGMTRESQEDHR